MRSTFTQLLGYKQLDVTSNELDTVFGLPISTSYRDMLVLLAIKRPVTYSAGAWVGSPTQRGNSSHDLNFTPYSLQLLSQALLTDHLVRHMCSTGGHVISSTIVKRESGSSQTKFEEKFRLKHHVRLSDKSLSSVSSVWCDRHVSNSVGKILG